jgi:hypothetical protein
MYLISSGCPSSKTGKLFPMLVPLFSVLLLREPVRLQNASPLLPAPAYSLIVTAVMRGAFPTLGDIMSLPQMESIDCLFSTVVKSHLDGTSRIESMYTIVDDTQYPHNSDFAAITRLKFNSDPLDKDCLCRAVNQLLNRERHRKKVLHMLYMQDPLLLILDKNLSAEIISASGQLDDFSRASEALVLALIGFSIAGCLPLLTVYAIYNSRLSRELAALETLTDEEVGAEVHLLGGDHFARGNRRALARILMRHRRLRI